MSQQESKYVNYSLPFLRKPGYQDTGTLPIRVKRGILFHLPLRHGNAGDEYNHEGNKKRSHEPDPSKGRGQGDEIYAPPHGDLAEIVWMPCISPQPRIQDFSPAVRIFYKPVKLPVSHRLEEKSDQPYEKPRSVKQRQGIVPGGIDDQHRRYVDDEDQPLEDEHLEVAPENEPPAPFLPPILIPPVFAFAPVSQKYPDRKSRAPHQHQECDKKLSGGKVSPNDQNVGGGQDKPEAPGDIGNAVVFEDLRL